MTRPDTREIHGEAYRRLPGRGHQLMGVVPYMRTSLWAGSDHLLAVRHGFGFEQYRRFFYGEIEAILIQENRHRWIWSCLLAAPALPCLIVVGAAVAFANWWLAAAAAVPALVIAGLVFVNTLRGPACTCHLRTAAQQAALPALSRMGHARRAVEMLRPLIAAAQVRPGESQPDAPADRGTDAAIEAAEP